MTDANLAIKALKEAAFAAQDEADRLARYAEHHEAEAKKFREKEAAHLAKAKECREAMDAVTITSRIHRLYGREVRQ